ncbi:VWA domain-containing protein [Deinococcus sp. JMULE3]|uniref:vWA domain-containing protein n=1 Tax=Deinococcus sp. JMULE3 TaxID=2518341 RepID=UPI0015763CFA|nr:VWA domain-containing protein [Deinococcus sp. JMULE3]
MKKLLIGTMTISCALLASCDFKGAPTTPAATTGTVNGVRVVNDTTYQVGFTPLSDTSIVTNGKLDSATVKTISAGSATARVCGQVQVQDTITAAISLDSTGSMADNDPNLLRRDAAKRFVSRMSSQDRAAVLSFDFDTTPNANLGVSYLWQDFTGDKTLLNTGIDNATFAGGGTPLYGAIVDGSTLVKASGGTNGSLLILTDGEDNAYIDQYQQAIDTARANGTKVYAIGLDARGNLDFSALEDIATATGGLFQKANDAAALDGFFDRMYNAFRAQGCVELVFTQKPATGTEVTGTLNIVVSAPDRKAATVEVPFTFTVR